MINKVSIIIPTLNSEKVLSSCLQSIARQDYPKSKIEIIIVDGGSTDNTLKIAQKYNCHIINNPLKTGEAGKAIGLKNATGCFFALIDSDNILPSIFWLKQMIQPLLDQPQAIGSEPLSFTYRSQAGFIERYSALIGANDPYAFVSGISDRLNHLDGRWTHLPINQTDYKNYLLLNLDPQQILPTIGANGTVFKASFLKKQATKDYFFDIDILSQLQKPFLFVKTKNSIIHTFCESSVKKFVNKQRRRLIDYYHYLPHRHYRWQQNQTKNNFNFIFHTVFISPILALIGFIKKPDPAWFFHPLACWLTLYLYSYIALKHRLGLLKSLNRSTWQQ